MTRIFLPLLITFFSLSLWARLPGHPDIENKANKTKVSFILCRDAAGGVFRIKDGPCPNGLPPIRKIFSKDDKPLIQTTELLTEDVEDYGNQVDH